MRAGSYERKSEEQKIHSVRRALIEGGSNILDSDVENVYRVLIFMYFYYFEL